MLTLSGGLVVLFFVLLIAFGFIPAIVAHRRNHQNKYAVYVANAAFLFGPFPDEYKWIAAAGWMVCLVWSFWKSPEVKVIPGPKGDNGDKGDGVVLLSKAGTVSDPFNKE